jgi:drug/metabolite transporter (DMT)-like permease
MSTLLSRLTRPRVPEVTQAAPMQDEPLYTHKAVAGAAPAPSRSNWLAIGLSLLTVYIIWGSTYLAIAFAIRGFPLFLMAGLRFLIAGGSLYLFLRLRGASSPNRRQWAGAAIVGAFLLVGSNGLVVFAEQYVATGVSALVIATVPLWAILFARFWGRWPGGKEWIGLLVGFAGIVCLNLGGGLHATPVGAGALLLAAMFWALGSVWSQHLPLPAGAMSSAAEMLFGGCVLTALGLVSNERIVTAPPAASIWALGYLIVFGSLVAFSAYGYLLKHVRPSLATSSSYVNPVVALVLGAAFDGEQITGIELVALVFILAGVVLVMLGQQKQRGEKEQRDRTS